MTTHVVIAAIGNDKPGIIHRVSAKIKQEGGNIEIHKAVKISGNFVQLIYFSLPPSREYRAAINSIKKLSDEELFIVGRKARPVSLRRPAPPYCGKLEVSGTDEVGIIGLLALILFQYKVNIETLDYYTRISHAPMTGIQLFELSARIEVPQETDIKDLRSRLHTIKENFTAEMIFECPVDPRNTENGVLPPTIFFKHKNRTYIVLTAIGKDEPGFVYQIASRITQSCGNIEFQKSFKMGGSFGVISLFTVKDCEGSAEEIINELHRLRTRSQVIFARKAVHYPLVRDHHAVCGDLLVVGKDRKGLIEQISRVLKKDGINIEALEFLIDSTNTGDCVTFKMEMRLLFPPGTDMDVFRKKLTKLEERLNADFLFRFPKGC